MYCWENTLAVEMPDI